MLDAESGLNKVKNHARKIVLEVDKFWCFLVRSVREICTRYSNIFHIK